VLRSRRYGDSLTRQKPPRWCSRAAGSVWKKLEPAFRVATVLLRFFVG
jgi:hypothetical protein